MGVAAEGETPYNTTKKILSVCIYIIHTDVYKRHLYTHLTGKSVRVSGATVRAEQVFKGLSQNEGLKEVLSFDYYLNSY